MSAAEKAFKDWKEAHKINLRVYSDDQMFAIGYHWRDDEIEQLMTKIEKMDKAAKKLKAAAKAKE
jgi:hypothetical protein